MNRYDDIINLPHHVSQNHPPMPMRDRAAQFAPFAALTGYDNVIAETVRQTEQKRELSAQEQAELNQRIVFLSAHLPEQPEVRIRYFVPDERKAGGLYRNITLKIKKFFEAERRLVAHDGTSIRIDDIASIDGVIFHPADPRISNSGTNQ